MRAHDWLDTVTSKSCVVKGNSANIVVEDVGFNYVVEDMLANKAKVTIDSGRGSTSKVPRLGLVVRKCRVGVLEIGDGHYRR